MSDQPRPILATLSASLWRRIDLICNRFEEAWKEGQRPRLTDYLATTPEPGRSVLLRELLDLELAYRRKTGDTPMLEEYRQLLPEHAELVEILFRNNGALAGESKKEVETSHPATRPGVPALVGMPGSPVIPGYQLLGVLGQGGMGIVYKARQLSPPRMVALKMILGAEQAFSDQRTRFRAEAEAIARLNHPNIVQIYEVGEHAGQPFFSLEFVDGVTLAHKATGTPPRPLKAAELVETLARAMHHAHQRGLVHRDLKPANILLREDGVAKITDFGLARFLDSGAGLTQTRDFLGTPAFTSPEQASGKAYAAGPAADVYSLGGILYFLLTSRAPFQGNSVQRTLELVRTEEPLPPRRSQPGCPRDLETICLKCLRKEPHKRYASAEELADDLNRFRQGEPIHARPTPRWERLLKWCKRRPTTAALTGVVLLLALLGAIGWTVVEVRERQRLHDTARDADAGLRAGSEAADRQQWSEMEAHLDNVQKAVANEPSLADLKTREEKLREAFAQFRRFLRQRDEALFQGVFLALFPGQRIATPSDPAAVEEELASWLSKPQRTEMAVGRYEVLFVRADIEARNAGARRALEMLDEAVELSQKTYAYHLRRAYYLGLLGAREEQKRERALLEASPPGTALDYFLTGFHLYLQGERGDAVRSFESALRVQPDHFWSQLYLAVNQLHLGNWAAAEYALNTCQLLRPGFLWVLLLRGYAQVEQGKFGRAEADLRQAESTLERRPADQAAASSAVDREARGHLHFYRGILYLQQNQPSRAEEQFRLAIAQQPTFFQHRVALVRVCLEQNQFLEADRQFQQLKTLSPPAEVLAEYYTLRARKLSQQGRYGEIVDACNAAVDARKEQAEAYFLRATAQLHFKDYQKAVGSYTTYLALGAQRLPGVYQGRGLAFYMLGRFPEAEEDFTKALEFPVVAVGAKMTLGLATVVTLRGLEAELLEYRGLARFRSDAFQLALLDFDKALRISPRRCDSCIGRGMCLVKLGHYREAVADARGALRLRPGTPEMMFNVGCIFAMAAGEVRKDKTQPGRQDLEAEYRSEAVKRIRSALEMLRPAQPSAVWEKAWRADQWLDPIRDSAEFAQLDKDYSPPLPNNSDPKVR